MKKKVIKIFIFVFAFVGALGINVSPVLAVCGDIGSPGGQCMPGNFCSYGSYYIDSDCGDHTQVCCRSAPPEVTPEIQNPFLSPAIRNLSGHSFFAFFLPKLITLGFVLAALLFFFMLLISGLRYITSAGNKVEVEAARSSITSAFTGLVLVFSLYAVLKLVEAIFGIKLTSIDLGQLIL